MSITTATEFDPCTLPDQHDRNKDNSSCSTTKIALSALTFLATTAAGAGIAAAITFSAVPIVIGAIAGSTIAIVALVIYHLATKSKQPKPENIEEDQDSMLYDEAYTLLQEKQYDEARRTAQKMTYCKLQADILRRIDEKTTEKDTEEQKKTAENIISEENLQDEVPNKTASTQQEPPPQSPTTPPPVPAPHPVTTQPVTQEATQGTEQPEPDEVPQKLIADLVSANRLLEILLDKLGLSREESQQIAITTDLDWASCENIATQLSDDLLRCMSKHYWKNNPSLTNTQSYSFIHTQRLFFATASMPFHKIDDKDHLLIRANDELNTAWGPILMHLIKDTRLDDIVTILSRIFSEELQGAIFPGVIRIYCDRGQFEKAKAAANEIRLAKQRNPVLEKIEAASSSHDTSSAT